MSQDFVETMEILFISKENKYIFINLIKGVIDVSRLMKYNNIEKEALEILTYVQKI